MTELASGMGSGIGGMGSMFSGAASGIGGLFGGAGGLFGGGSDRDDDRKELEWANRMEYWRNQFRTLNDPFQMQGLQGMSDLAGKDLMGMGRAMGNRQADTTSRGLQDALSSRGGGNLSSALGMGAQARVGAGLQGLQSGFGMQQQALSGLTSAAQSRLSMMNQLYGALTGVTVAGMGSSAQVQSSEIGANAQMWSSLFGSLGSMAKSSGAGGSTP